MHARQKRCTHIFHMNHGEVEKTGEWSEHVTTICRRLQMFGLFRDKERDKEREMERRVTIEEMHTHISHESRRGGQA